MSKSSQKRMQALQNVFVFLILLYSNISVRDQALSKALPRHAHNALTTSYEAG